MTAGQSVRPAGGEGRSAAAARGRRPGCASERECFFDNARFLAVVLVVVAHAWEPLLDGNRMAKALYMVVYAFHMPAFIIVFGHSSRDFSFRAERLQRLISGVITPYILFETVYSLFKRYAGGDAGYPVSLLDPWYLTWFLVALCVWRLTTPLWRLVRWPVPLALAVAALAGTSKMSDDLDLQRVLQFLPFFVLGLVLEPRHFSLVRSWNVRLLALPVFAASLAFAYWAAPRMTLDWFYRGDSADELGVATPVPVVMTLAMFLCSMILVAGFFSWVPGRRLWITGLGATTLYVYLLHGFLVKGAEYAGWYDHAFVHTPRGEAVVTLIATAAALLLGTPPFRAVFRFALEPRMAWIFRKPPAGRGSARK